LALGTNSVGGTSADGMSLMSTMVFLDGSTDYIDIKLYSNVASGTWRTAAVPSCYFQAAWIRS